MSVSRRGFVRTLTGRTSRVSAPPAWISARGREAIVGEFGSLDFQAASAAAEASDARQTGRGRANRPAVTLRLSSNENPLGPSNIALAAMESSFKFTGRYPMNATPAIADLVQAIATKFNVETSQVGLGCGSGEVLNCAVRAFTDEQRGVVTAEPSYLEAPNTAKRFGRPVVTVPVGSDGGLDLAGMVTAASGAGLVFLCNPNNPTATVHSAQAVADVVSQIEASSPDTVVLVDEAYHDYVTDPSYESAVSLISQHRNVLVARTFSKAHGMAGMRTGYGLGQPELMARLNGLLTPFNSSVMALAATVASLADDAGLAAEKARNTAAKELTIDFFKTAGYEVIDSQTNFMFVKLGRPASEFRDACREHGIAVGRDFPPMEKTHCRISIGTMDEMQQAIEVFKSALEA